MSLNKVEQLEKRYSFKVLEEALKRAMNFDEILKYGWVQDYSDGENLGFTQNEGDEVFFIKEKYNIDEILKAYGEKCRKL